MCTPLVKCFAILLMLPLMAGCSHQSLPHPVDPSAVADQEGRKKVLTDDSSILKQIQKPTTTQQRVILNAPIISQKPELLNGCEVTSLAMLLQYAGFHVGKMELANQIKKDRDPLRETGTGTITHWGNPNHGFVGDITGKTKGYAVYHKPTEQLMKHYLSDRTLNLTDSSFKTVLNQIRKKRPVIVWTTAHFSEPIRWGEWKHGNQQIKATLEEHAVLLVGFDPAYVYVNDPLTGRKAQKIKQQLFIQSWLALGRQALSYR